MQSISEIMLSQITDILSVKFSFLLKSVHDELVNKYDINEDDMNDIWSRIAPDIKLNMKESDVKPNKKCITNSESDCCIFIFKKGGRKGEQCDRKKAKRSSLGYCSIHIKEECEDDVNTETSENKTVDDTTTCCFTFKKGPKKGDCCTNKVSKSSKMGYCVVHKKEEMDKQGMDKEGKKRKEFNSKETSSKSEDDSDTDNHNDKSPCVVKKTINIKEAIKHVKKDWSDCETDSDSDDNCFRKT